MGTPAVSIVLPTYNGSRYLEQSVRSCLDQSFTDFELIIVDDCSKDETPAIIARLAAADSRVRPIRNETNKRLPGALNAGFAASRGDYLTWTSDDNLYQPTAIAEMVAALASQPDVGLVYALMTDIDDAGELKGPGFNGPPEWLAHCNPVGACFMYRREVYESIGDYADDLFLAEDWDYWFRIAQKFRIVALRNDLYFYRRHEGSLTQQRRKQVMEAGWQLLERHLPDMRWVNRGTRSRGYLAASRYAWKAGDRVRAFKLAGRAVSESPFYFARWVYQTGLNSLKQRSTQPAR